MGQAFANPVSIGQWRAGFLAKVASSRIYLYDAISRSCARHHAQLEQVVPRARKIAY